MRTVDLSPESISAAELFDLARGDSLLVKTDGGDTFVVSPADEFSTEVEILRHNHEFLIALDRFREDHETIPLDQVEERLR